MKKHHRKPIFAVFHRLVSLSEGSTLPRFIHHTFLEAIGGSSIINQVNEWIVEARTKPPVEHQEKDDPSDHDHKLKSRIPPVPQKEKAP